MTRFFAACLAVGVLAGAIVGLAWPHPNPPTTHVHAAQERHHDRFGDPLAWQAGLLDRTPPTNPPTTTTTVAALRIYHGAPYPTDELLERLARCETGGKMNNPNTGNGYYGYFQFDLSTWREVGGTGYPHEHPYHVQREKARALILKPDGGWGRFPTCSRVIGAR